MFEIIMQRIEAFVAVIDRLVAEPGPTVTFFVAMFFAIAAAQLLKFPLSWYVTDKKRFDFYTRTIAVLTGFLFAHFLSEKLLWAWELGAGLASIGFYHLSLAGIRRWWPWLETKPLVGAVEPPLAAFVAAAIRKADKADPTDQGAA